MTHILHIISQADWQQVQQESSYRPASLDGEGFIHFSTPEQIAATANRFYPGRRDLLVLVVDSDRLMAPLRYEAPSGGGSYAPDERFPHLYGSLNLDAVVQVVPFTPNADGIFEHPPAF